VEEEAGENQLVNFITYGCESSASFFIIYKKKCGLERKVENKKLSR
jgi:hypothetical protein